MKWKCIFYFVSVAANRIDRLIISSFAVACLLRRVRAPIVNTVGSLKFRRCKDDCGHRRAYRNGKTATQIGPCREISLRGREKLDFKFFFSDSNPNTHTIPCNQNPLMLLEKINTLIYDHFCQ